MTTFVSCIFETIISEEIQEYSDTHYKYARLVSQWGEANVFLKVYVKDPRLRSFVHTLVKDKPHIQVADLTDIRDESWASNIDLDQCVLPENRNKEKDTRTHIWNTLHKYPCLAHCVMENPFQTAYFAYMDSDVFDLFRDRRTIGYIREHFGNNSLFMENPHGLYIPGCWGKLDPMFVKSPEYKHNIHWRFCGAFVFGAAHTILSFYEIYKQYFETYIQQADHCLSWEVNYWAWLEAVVGDQTRIQWYAGNHDDTLIRVPRTYGYHVLKRVATEYKTHRYEYPDLSPYRPMSASLTPYKGQYIMNTRYVNYWIYDSGAYWYPEDEHKIRTKNVCSVFSPEDSMTHPTCFHETQERFPPPIVKRANVFSEGVEDIRLYVSQKTGKLMFIGSTLGYSYTDKIRMIVGEYHVLSETTETETETETKDTAKTLKIKYAYLTNACLVTSPYDQWCEKNWCPIPMREGEDGFVYKWHPLEIGRLVESNGTYDLKIVHRVPTNTEIFGKVKGSTPFRKHGENQLMGMVHYSEETNPRQYYNRIVVLDAETFEVIQCTESFCFEQTGVGFCMSMEILDTKLVFWISQRDRDPMMIEMEKTFFDDKWIAF